MIWNTDFVFPSLMVLGILLAYYFFRPRLPNRMNKAFLVLIVADIATIVADLLSTAADNHYESLSVPLVSALNLVYFVAFVFRILAFFHLTTVILKLDTPACSWKNLLFHLVFIASELIVLSSPFTGAVYTVDGTGYHRGPLYDILPVCAFFYLALEMFLLVRYRRRLRAV